MPSSPSTTTGFSIRTEGDRVDDRDDAAVGLGEGERRKARDDALADDLVGEIAAANKIVLYELTPVQASLEEAFMELTRDEVEFRPVESVGLAA